MTAPLVVVAHDSDAIRGVIEVLLRQAGMQVRSVADGRACVEVLLTTTPVALVLDAALADVLAFTVIETARKQFPTLRIVLIASIYNRTSYKRRPTSLYGADDYVEQHHIADSLLSKLGHLPEVSSPAAPSLAVNDDDVRSAGEARLGTADDGGQVNPAAVARAERLARLIVTDIALYNGDAMGGVAPATSVEQLEARLRLDLEEGRVLFDLRVPIALRKSRDFIGEALAALLRETRSQGSG